jgi:hypothetical protein
MTGEFPDRLMDAGRWTHSANAWGATGGGGDTVGFVLLQVIKAYKDGVVS